MKKRPKSEKFTPLSDLIGALVETTRVDRNIDVLTLWDDWDVAAGPEFSTVTKPAVFKDDLLIVHVKSAPWLHQLQFQEQDLLRNINQHLGGVRIRQIRFKIGSISRKPQVD